MNKPNFEKWTAQEMRACRRELINEKLHSGEYSLRRIIIRVQTMELLNYGLELKRYYYYEYK
mgnify:CR=1 FL=1